MCPLKLLHYLLILNFDSLLWKVKFSLSNLYILNTVHYIYIFVKIARILLRNFLLLKY